MAIVVTDSDASGQPLQDWAYARDNGSLLPAVARSGSGWRSSMKTRVDEIAERIYEDLLQKGAARSGSA